MKKYLLIFFTLLFSLQSFSQLLSWTPAFPVESTTPFIITVDASKGNQGLLNYNPADVYVHIGVITNLSTSSSDWKYVKTTWGTTDPAAKATSLGNNKWSFTITGGLRTYFGLTNTAETIQKIAVLFRSGNGNLKQANADGSDMYIRVYTSALAVRITNPFFQPTYKTIPELITKTVGDNIPLTALSNKAATLKLYSNGNVIQTATSATTISANLALTASGNQQIIAEANDGVNISRDTVNFFVTSAVNIAPLPAGVKDGINYNPNNTSATLVLYAPGKTRVCVIGEFSGSNWVEQTQFEMNKTPDGNYWWIMINGLTPAKEYSFQYLVNGTLKIAEPYTEKILDPANDQYISASTYPNLKAYPTGLTTGIVSILQTAQPVYNWQVNNFSRPDKRSLVIYELLVRDFVANHDWKTLSDTLNYLKKLGINAIEVMPFNEFEGNISWGYNPDFYFAPDKYYGPENTLKAFIDKCHENGIAVIMDMVLNHSFGSSPLVQLYWDSVNNRPAPDNPWFNPVAKHAYNVGYDMNHESPATHYFVSRVLSHWLNNYKIDGFRFDLSKGFTQTQTCDTSGNNCDVAAWGHYDQSRINIWKGYYDTLQLKSPSAYCILEHFADNSEETVLANDEMMLWGNENYNYNQATMGYNTGWDFSYGIANQRGWSNPYLVTYMESHDEERLMYKNIQYGNSSGTYNIKDTATALKRQEMAAAFFFTIPGPKMLWQFGELGYDYSINTCADGSVNNACRTDPKPIRWDYLQQPNRKKLHDVYSKLIKLRFDPSYESEFISNTTAQDFSGSVKWLRLSKIVAVGNFDVVNQSASIYFPTNGIWYDYLNGTTINVTGNNYTFSNLLPGEYHVFTATNVVLPVTLVSFNGIKQGNANVLSWQVANEINLNYYELQKCEDGQNFSPIAKINASGKSNYSYADNDLASSSSIEYYRLKSVDIDGKFDYSGIVKIRRDITNWQARVNPNPFTSDLKLNIESPVQDKADLIITDLSGRQLFKQNISISAGTNSFDIYETNKLAKGSYLLTIIASQQAQSIKVIKSTP
ncbi:MAG: alpha-amylase family glycosyl hydrolase [Bacteroidota bacterium]|nr:alpha-amylase family glycosyl hydrolase [Bacteroidota bacterium]